MYIDDPIGRALNLKPAEYEIEFDLSEYFSNHTSIPAWNKGIPHSPEQMELIRERVASGKHNFGPEHTRRMIAEGKHPWVGGEQQRKSNKIRIADGSHNLLGPEHALKRMREGTHPFQHLPTLTCPHCGKSGKPGPMRRWHFDHCKDGR